MKFWISVALILVADQLSKLWVMNSLAMGESRPLIDNVLFLTYVHNPGAAFGMMAGRSWLFLLCALIVIVLMVFYNIRYYPSGAAQFSMGLIVGGALGNFIDRLWFGAVRDFFDLGWWPVFNIADIGIVCGGILLMGYIIFKERFEEA
ncbi:MAG: signal peptidase II [Syntrophomonadaceae bacterium]